jgi:hypothetical protein
VLIFPILIRSALHAVLIALAFQVQAGGSNVTAARADENSETLYPGRCVANCWPTPIVCTCEADSEGQTSVSNNHKKSYPTYRISANGGLVAPDMHRGHSIGKASLNKQTQEERPNFR